MEVGAAPSWTTTRLARARREMNTTFLNQFICLILKSKPVLLPLGNGKPLSNWRLEVYFSLRYFLPSPLPIEYFITRTTCGDPSHYLKKTTALDGLSVIAQ